MSQESLWKTMFGGKRQMKIDCNFTEKFFKEWDRMCVSYARCEQCEIKEIMKTYQILDCRTLTMKHWEEVINAVQKWSDEHQQETRAEHFLKMFPNAQLSNDGRPSICVAYFNENIKCNLPERRCTACWDMPYNGEF